MMDDAEEFFSMMEKFFRKENISGGDDKAAYLKCKLEPEVRSAIMRSTPGHGDATYGDMKEVILRIYGKTLLRPRDTKSSFARESKLEARRQRNT
jgi:hypothetical protein